MKRLFGILSIISCLILFGCKSIQYVPVESVVYRDRVENKLVHDSIHVSDSVLIMQKGDTVYRDRWRNVYINRNVTDTFIRVDSIKFPVIVEIEKPLSWWENIKMEYGGLSMGALIGIIIIIGFSFIKVSKK